MKRDFGLYREEFEHDSCGIGCIVSIDDIASHKIIDDSLTILENLEHRGGMGSEENTGDGAGILTGIPHELFQELNCINVNKGEYAVMMMFIPYDKDIKNDVLINIKEVVNRNNFEVLNIREVPINSSILGKTSKKSMPYIYQVFLNRPSTVKNDRDYEKKLYLLRRILEKDIEQIYISSLSSKTIVYKGMLLSTQLRKYYKDLRNTNYKASFALVHSRFSTNTFPSWERAHPNRMIIHNGEINTIRGNINKVYSRRWEKNISEDLQGVLPIITKEGSDSACFDNTLEFITMNGIPLEEGIMMMIPEAYENQPLMSNKKRDFYEYSTSLMEPWDGPAAIVFTDGFKIGAVLDRNGLRPARYYLTKDNHLILSSEVGALVVDEKEILKKDRLEAGKMLLVDLASKKLVSDDEIKEVVCSRKDYSSLVKDKIVTLDKEHLKKSLKYYDKDKLLMLQKAFNYSYEDITNTIQKMAEDGEEPLVSMGVDTNIALLNDKDTLLFNYFKQLFAQVTNPPIDAIREYIITSTNLYLGKSGDLLNRELTNKVLKITNPVMYNEDLIKLTSLQEEDLEYRKLCMTFNPNYQTMKERIESLRSEAIKAIEDGVSILILSDRNISETNVMIPCLLGVSAIHQHLIREGKRSQVAIIVESGEPREIHHFATLLGFGASAINPYMVYENIKLLCDNGLINKTYEESIYNYNKAALKGIIKVVSKMGISSIQSYQGAQIFEALGLNEEFVDEYFTKTVSRIGGIGLDEIESDTIRNHNRGFKEIIKGYNDSVDSPGINFVRADGNEHLYNANSIYLLQQSTRRGDYKLFKEYTNNIIENEFHIRGLLDFKYSKNPIPLEEVESVDSIVKRFKTGAMSYGSISKEAHEALAIAMNEIGGKSNTGEGGEDRERFYTSKNAKDKRSAIKQVASGRFGVTSEYLVNADEIQIKIAQGAKPGEGGQLPGNKVYPWVAKTRNSTTGVGLISPPPHHDIYSIEDLAELIFDLKNANMKADITVKLVSETGVGTVAAGVAKGGAHSILISGYDGGTGASPKTSISNAGLPWELGLAETHQTLVMNNLRSRVKLEVDGKLMSGRDLAIACLLGAEEFGFATAPLVALGCVMMRVCNKDTCPVGIATQNETLRKNFNGKPEYVINFMHFMAMELREYMSLLGFKTINDMVGHSEVLIRKENIKGEKAKKIDLSSILMQSENTQNIKFDEKHAYNFNLKRSIDMSELVKKFSQSIKMREFRKTSLVVKNTDRALGTILSSEITKKYKNKGLEEGTIELNCTGYGGQSFGAFLTKGIKLILEGDFNDYLAKGLSGGTIIIKTPKGVSYKAHENIIGGNVALYGATSGKVFINGIVGERFCVRNSGATAVCEGVGAHGLEYMTGGIALILGEVGINFAAGMSGGIGYILDENNTLKRNLNRELIVLELPSDEEYNLIFSLIKEHVNETGSEKGKMILSKFDEYKVHFNKVIPRDYKKVIEIYNRYISMGLKEEDALIDTFNELR
ncbi:MAG: glutamate synthase large subunit [Clostridium sp.]